VKRGRRPFAHNLPAFLHLHLPGIRARRPPFTAAFTAS